jgi:radical SAM superfamily enzyme YgiQ (UPF0313 family)
MHGYNPVLYDIDVKRPSEKELFEYFEKAQPDIVGISAVVSTGYAYTKRLSSIIKKASSTTQIILGGNLAAAYEVILRKCQIDLCVIGEGEKVLLNLIKHYEKYFYLLPVNDELDKIKGIAFLNSRGICRFTGFEEQISSDEIQEPDYELLNRFSDINHYIRTPIMKYDFGYDQRSKETHRQGKKMATIFTAKGCINRCSFCHRWIKGYRVISIEKILVTMKHLIDKYNVGFFCITDECFGENKEWLEKFIEAIKPLDILFQVGGARVSIVKRDPSVIRRLKAVGMTGIYFGMESGSEKILNIMEKNANRYENLMAAKLCADVDVFTVIQLVIGMPGENEQTINETIAFIKEATGDLPYPPILSVNYLQALPGTPSYEYLRKHGFLGKSINDEEQYLLKISDINAVEFKQYINVSEEPLSKVKLWQRKIYNEARTHWLKKHAWKLPVEDNSSNLEYLNSSFISRVRFFLRKKLIYYRMIDLFGNVFWKIFQISYLYSLYDYKKAVRIMLGIVSEENRSSFKCQAVPLRKIVSNLKTS